MKILQVGEIMGKVDLFMKGYLNRPEETAKFFGNDGFVGVHVRVLIDTMLKLINAAIFSEASSKLKVLS